MHVNCCIAGGGPAGMMLGLLLARAGVEVIILEKHADFLRDFRGDTIHPSTLEVMYELGALDEFLERPHQEMRQIAGQVADEIVTVADFSHLPTHCKFIAFMPQWDFLNFVSELGRQYPTFHLYMNSEVIDLLEQDGRITGVKATMAGVSTEIKSDLVVGADGRHSIVREKGGLTVESLGAPIDVLWFRVSRRSVDGAQTLGKVLPGKVMVMLNREDYWQCAFVIPKGQFESIQKKGLESFLQEISTVAPFLGDRVEELKSWSDIKLLTVLVDRLKEWCRPGLLCIGDAAHAMSPIGGVGINLAIQDAVAAANILAIPLSANRLRMEDLRSVQRRRSFPTKLTQRLQIFIQNRVIGPALSSPSLSLPWPLKALRRWPFLRRIPARVVGIGFRAEHVKSPDIFRTDV